MPPGWPTELRHEEVLLRPLRVSDARAWQRVREANIGWLREWDATRPPGPHGGPTTYRAMTRSLLKQAKEGRVMPFVIEIDGHFVGQVTVSGIAWGSARWCQLGYWIDRQVAGRGIVPRSVALVVDHCFASGLHRVEIAIRPENANSLRVVEKLEVPYVGLARNFLHINGAWRDHHVFAVTVEDLPSPGMLDRLLRNGSERSAT